MPVRLGIVGAGEEARGYIEVLNSLDEARVVAVCDRDFNKAEATARRYKARPFRDARALFKSNAPSAKRAKKPAGEQESPQTETSKSETLDAVCIVSAERARAEAVTLALSNSCDVYVVSPLAGSLDKAQQQMRLAQEQRTRLWLGHPERFAASLEQARKLVTARGTAVFACNGSWPIDAREVASPRLAKATQEAAWLQSLHRLLDTLRFLQGEIRSVSAQGSIESTALNIEWKNGAVGAFALHHHCEKALDWTLRDGHLAWRENGLTLRRGLETQHFGAVHNAAREALRGELRAWLQAVESGRRTLAKSTPQDALQTLRVVLAVQQSLKTRRVVSLGESPTSS